MKLSEVPGAFQNGKTGGKLAAARVVMLQPSDFADTWKSRPVKAIAVGLRRLPATDEDTASAEASRKALELFPDDIEGATQAYNNALAVYAVARGLCDPNDVTKAHPAFEMAEDMVEHALTSRAITRLFDELEKLLVESSPLHPEATDDELLLLGAMLLDDDLRSEIMTTIGRRARRYLAFALADIEKTTARTVETAPDL